MLRDNDTGSDEMLKLAVLGAKRNGRHVGICGEAPANYPEIAHYLAQLGIELDQREPVKRATHDAGGGRGRNGQRRATSRSALLRSDPSSERHVKRANKQPQYFLPLGSMLSPNDMLLAPTRTIFAHTLIAVPLPHLTRRAPRLHATLRPRR